MGLSGCPGRQTQRAVAGARPVVAQVLDFSHTLIWSQKGQRERLCKLGSVCACMSVEPLPVNLVPTAARTSL